MQTFVTETLTDDKSPYEIFMSTALVLDRKRLGKQRVETLQIMSSLTGLRIDSDGEVVERTKRGWSSHPAVKMWRGYEMCLYVYQFAVCETWSSFSFSDSCLGKTAKLLVEAQTRELVSVEGSFPDWLKNPEVAESHRSNLVRKYPEHYRKYFPSVSDDLPYVWPVE